jgi:hypothetical protein
MPFELDESSGDREVKGWPPSLPATALVWTAPRRARQAPATPRVQRQALAHPLAHHSEQAPPPTTRSTPSTQNPTAPPPSRRRHSSNQGARRRTARTHGGGAADRPPRRSSADPPARTRRRGQGQSARAYRLAAPYHAVGCASAGADVGGAGGVGGARAGLQQSKGTRGQQQRLWGWLVHVAL